MKGLAFAVDPDGYWIELIKKGGYQNSQAYYTEEQENQKL